jgi:hypothetical protein
VSVNDKNRVVDVFTTLEGGVESGFDPSLIGPKQYAWGVNCTARGGFIQPRPGWRFQGSTGISGYFQGHGNYVNMSTQVPYLILAVAGRMYSVNINASFATTDITIATDPNNATAPKTWILQANKWLIAQNRLDLPWWLKSSR